MKLKRAEFCPLCGCRSLERDTYRLTHTNKRGRKGLTSHTFDSKPPEFICRSCGAAFMLSPSLRHEHAVALIADERRKRPPHEHNKPVPDVALVDLPPAMRRAS